MSEIIKYKKTENIKEIINNISFDYNNKLQEFIKNSINLGYIDNIADVSMTMGRYGKNIICKNKKIINNKITKIECARDILLSIEADKPFRLILDNNYITPWIKSTKEYKITIPILSLSFHKIYLETDSNEVIYENILLTSDERRQLRCNPYILNININNFLIHEGCMINIINYNIWNCKKSHLKKSEKYQKLYKILSKNTKLSHDIINLIIEQQYVIVDPGVCKC
jgi:hypothetical protein